MISFPMPAVDLQGSAIAIHFFGEEIHFQSGDCSQECYLYCKGYQIGLISFRFEVCSFAFIFIIALIFDAREIFKLCYPFSLWISLKIGVNSVFSAAAFTVWLNQYLRPQK